MSDNPILPAIAASTPEAPVLLSLKLWQHESDPEIIVSAFVVKPTAPPIPLTFWAGDVAKNVRDAPAGKVVGQLAQGQSVDVDMSTLKSLTDASGVTHKWAMIVSVNFKGDWIATDVLTVIKPNFPIPSP